MQNKEKGGCEMPVARHTSGFGGAMHEGTGMVARAIEDPDPAHMLFMHDRHVRAVPSDGAGPE